MDPGYDLYSGKSPEDANGLLANSEYGFLSVWDPVETRPEMSFMHYVHKPAEGEIWGHLANSNPLLKQLQADSRATFTVHGPNAYVPSHWRDSSYSVPTSYYSWAQFELQVMLVRDEEQILDLLVEMLARFQPEGFHPALDPADKGWRRMAGAITGLKMKIRASRSRFKYGQNRSEEHRRGIVGQLRKRGYPQDEPVAQQVLQRLGDGISLEGSEK